MWSGWWLTLSIIIASISNVLGSSEVFLDHLLCWDNRADVVIHLENGQTFLLRHDIGWPLIILPSRYMTTLSDGKPIVELFPNLPEDVQLGFTMPQIDKRLKESLTALPGKTLFIKPPHYFLYQNRKFLRSETLQYWEQGPFVDNRFTATLHNTSLLMVAKEGFVPDGLRRRSSIIGGQVFLFDTARFPEWIGVFTINNSFKHGFEWLKLRWLIPIYPGSTESRSDYLVILDEGLVKGHWYCLTKIDAFGHSSESTCQLKPLSSMFNCSKQLIQLKENNGVYGLWSMTGLPFSITIYSALGMSIALLIINIIMLINSWALFEQFSHIQTRTIFKKLAHFTSATRTTSEDFTEKTLIICF